jgi:hypothetical protein
VERCGHSTKLKTKVENKGPGREIGAFVIVVVAVAADYWLLGLFGPLTLAQTDARAAAVLVDEARQTRDVQ